MSNDINTILNVSNKLIPSAIQSAKENQPDVKPPKGIFEGKIKKFELVVINEKLAIRRRFSIIKEASGEYTGCLISDLLFLHSDKSIGFAMNSLISYGIKNVYERCSTKKMKAFEIFINEINKITDTFKFDLSYNEKGYANINLIQKIEPIIDLGSEVESIETEDGSKNTQESLNEQLSQEEIIDDFAEEFEEQKDDFYNDDDPSIPTLDGLEEEPLIEDSFESLKKDLQLFSFAHDLEIPNLKTIAGEEIVDQIKVRCVNGFKKSDLSSKEKALLKKAGLDDLIKK